jgi:hypothetical protein
VSGGHVFPVETRRQPIVRELGNIPDALISSPLWTWSPSNRRDVLHERRRRFGIEDERIDPTTVTEEGDDA